MLIKEEPVDDEGRNAAPQTPICNNTILANLGICTNVRRMLYRTKRSVSWMLRNTFYPTVCTEVIAKKGSYLENNLKLCLSVIQGYSTPLAMSLNSMVSTLYTHGYMEKSDVKYTSKLMEFKDGGKLKLDIASPPTKQSDELLKKVALVLPGVEGKPPVHLLLSSCRNTYYSL
ncbi:hypothetical protein ACOME3_008150 [Neoechinorhynchus agilis]